MTMTRTAAPLGIAKSAAEYERLTKALHRAPPKSVVQLDTPPVRVLAVRGNQPPGSEQYTTAVQVLFAMAWTLRLGLRLGTIRRPRGYFDFRVGPLGTRWWSSGPSLDVKDPRTLRWQAYVMVPAFVTQDAFRAARRLLSLKKPDVPWAPVSLLTLRKGAAIQALHVGPYHREEPTVERLLQYSAREALAPRWPHHEIYLNDPRRTPRRRLRTIIRLPVVRARRDHGHRSLR